MKKIGFLTLLFATALSSNGHAAAGDRTVLVQGVDPQLMVFRCGDNACSVNIKGMVSYNTWSNHLTGDMRSTIANAQMNGLVIDVVSTERSNFGPFHLEPSISLVTRPMSNEERENKIRSLMNELLQLRSTKQ